MKLLLLFVLPVFLAGCSLTFGYKDWSGTIQIPEKSSGKRVIPTK